MDRTGAKGGEHIGKMVSVGLDILSLRKRLDILMQLTGRKLEVCDFLESSGLVIEIWGSSPCSCG